MQTEQRSLAHSLVTHVQFRRVVRRQRVAFVMIQAVAVRGHARHENVTMEIAAARAHGAFDVAGGGPALPVVDVVENDIEFLPGQRGLHGLPVVAVGDQILYAAAQVMTRTAMQHRDGMLLLQQFGHQHPADEPSPSDNQAIHAGITE